MAKKKQKKEQPKKQQTTAADIAVDRYMHCGMLTETAAGEETVFCNGCHDWLKTAKLQRVDEKGEPLPEEKPSEEETDEESDHEDHGE